MKYLFLAFLVSCTAMKGADDLPAKTCEELIDDLQKLDGFTIGQHPTAWIDQFIAEESQPKFTGGIMGSQKPIIYPAMKELVARGTAAIPDLLLHLDDARPTKLEIREENHITWARICNDYNNKPLRGHGAYAYKEESLELPYRILVGDVCLVVLGQITNRPQVGVRYRPSGGVQICSPIKYPEIVASAREDWSGFQSSDLCSLLLDDIAQAKYPPEEEGALRRIKFYFPAHYDEALAAQKLKAEK